MNTTSSTTISQIATEQALTATTLLGPVMTIPVEKQAQFIKSALIAGLTQSSVVNRMINDVSSESTETSTSRKGKRKVPPTDDKRCRHMKKDGEFCRNARAEDKDICGTHFRLKQEGEAGEHKKRRLHHKKQKNIDDSDSEDDDDDDKDEKDETTMSNVFIADETQVDEHYEDDDN